MQGPHYVLSASGTEMARSFEESEAAAADVFTQRWLRGFERGDLKGMLATHNAYSEWAPKPPPGFNPVGITLPDDRVLAMYEAIMTARPRILGNVSDETLRFLRKRAAWDWASAGIGGSLRFDAPGDYTCALPPDVAARMIYFAAKQHTDYAMYRHIGVKKVTVSGVGGCDHCRSFLGKTFKIDKVPELPLPGCTDPVGCRCSAEAVIPEKYG